jgi:hypothetical protein
VNVKDRLRPEETMNIRPAPAAPAALAILALLLCVPAARAQVFHDLPGVISIEEHEAEEQVVCQPRYEPAPENSTRQRFGKTVYDCTRSGVTVTGSGMPLSRERELRGLDW